MTVPESSQGHAGPIQVITSVGGFAQVPLWTFEMGLTGVELATYVALRSFADRQGQAFPHMRTIANRAGVGLRTAERAVARLRALGMVVSGHRYGKDGSVRGCLFILPDIRPACEAGGTACEAGH